MTWWEWISYKWGPLESISWPVANTKPPAQCLTTVGKTFLVVSHFLISQMEAARLTSWMWEWRKKGMWKPNNQNLLSTVNYKSEETYWWVIHTLWWIRIFLRSFPFQVSANSHFSVKYLALKTGLYLLIQLLHSLNLVYVLRVMSYEDSRCLPQVH